MESKNKIYRISSILTMLSRGDELSTPNLSTKFNVTNKIIQTDFKEYILPMFEDEIYYNYSKKSYVSKNNFLLKTFLTVNELSIIAILKNKSKDKYSDIELYDKVESLFKNYEDNLLSNMYKKIKIEKVELLKKEIIELYNAIKNKKIIECIYENRKFFLYPLEIKNIDGYWYLICFDVNYNQIKKYKINSMINITSKNESFVMDKQIFKNSDDAINGYYKPEIKPIKIQLSLDKNVSNIFIKKPISNTQKIIKKYEDNSCDIELTVTDFMEILPTIQRWMPHIGVIEPMALKNIIKSNLYNYLRNFD